MKKNTYIFKSGKEELFKSTKLVFGDADMGDLKLLSLMLILKNDNGEVTIDDSFSRVSGLEKSEIEASLKYWRGAGFIEKADGTSYSDEKKKTKEAHKDGKLETTGEINHYGTKELADLLEKREVSAEFLDAAQRVWGKTFTPYDVSIAVGVVNQIGLSEEAALSIMSYCVKLEKKSLKYFERTAFDFYDEGITAVEDIQAKIVEIEKSNEIIFKVRKLFGAHQRALTTKEKKFFTKWARDFSFDIEVITLAYEITVDVTHEPSIDYANGILENWRKEGLKNADDIREFLEKKKQKKTSKTSASSNKSYDTEEFFEAALLRSIQKMK